MSRNSSLFWRKRAGRVAARRRRPALGWESLEQRLLLASDLPDLLIADQATDSIRRYDGTSAPPLQELPAFVTSGSGGLVDPHDPTFGPDGNLYVFSTQAGAQKILRYDGTSGAFLGTFVDTGAGGFSGGSQMAFGPDGNLYVATTSAAGVLRFDGATGTPLAPMAVGATARACGVVFGPDGNLYVMDSDAFVDTGADRVLRFDPGSGTFLDEFVAPGSLDDACLINFGPDGHLYVPDVQFGDVRVFSGWTGELLKVFSPPPALATPPAFEIFFGADGNTYATTGDDVLRYQGETSQFMDVVVDGMAASATFFPVGPSTDLQVTDVQIPRGAVQGKNVAIQYTVENQSLIPTAADEWVDVVYLSNDGNFDPSDLEIGRIARTGGLNADGSYTATLNATLASPPTGEFQVLVFADRHGAVPDTNRSNNFALVAEPLSIAAPLSPTHNQTSSIAVGRTMSAYSTQDITAGQLKLTYTVYNLTPAPVAGVLLTTTLQPGVDFAAASSPANQNGQELAWNLGTLGPFESRSIEVTVEFSGAVVPQIDSGPTAFAHVDGVAVSDDLGPAILRTTAIDPTLLAATADANAADPQILAKAAELDQNVNEIFKFVRDEVGFDAYVGSLRGARGALWSSAANSLDQASLLVAMLRASGVPARYAHGLLDDSLAQNLILDMFPDTYQAVGLIPQDATIADPANDAALLAEVRPHYWVQFDVGLGFSNADPAFSASTPGDQFTAVDTTFAEVPDELRHKVTVRVDRELAIPAFSLFGGSPLTRQTVIEHTFTAAELVGKPITIGQFVQNNSLVTPFTTAITNNFSPYLAVGDEDTSLEATHLIRGTDFQEFITNFPLGSQIFTGLFLEVDLVDPSGAVETYERTLADRIGFEVRHNGGSPNLLIGADSPTLVSESDVFTLFATAARSNPRRSDAVPRELQSITDQLKALPLIDPTGRTQHLERLASIGLTRVIGDALLQVSDAQSEQLSDTSLVRAYFDKPRLVIVSSRTNLESGAESLEISVDLRRNLIRVLPFPGQNVESSLAFQAARGLFENAHEESIIQQIIPQALQPPDTIGAIQVFEAAEVQNIQLVTITSEDRALLETLNISAEARARIALSLNADTVVVVPAKSVQIGATPAIAWFEINLVTGETIGVTEDGGHQSIAEFAATNAFSAAQDLEATTIKSLLAGTISGSLMNTAYSICRLADDDIQGCRQFITVEKEKIRAIAERLGSALDFKIFVAAFNATVQFAAHVDPPLPDVLLNAAPQLRLPENSAAIDVNVPATVAAGAVSGTLNTAHTKITGQLNVTWTSSTPVGLSLSSFAALNATVRDSLGSIVGVGTIALGSSASAIVRGNVTYDVSGRGTLASYAAATSGTGISGQWSTYTADLSGSATIELTSDALSLNGVLLPAGSYTINASNVSAAGSGASTAPDFLGAVTVDLVEGIILVGPAAEVLNVGGTSFDVTHGLALGGFSGSAAITAGDALDNITLSGNTDDVLRVSGGPVASAADQNIPATFNIHVQTSLAGLYTLQAEAPDGWTVTIDAAGVATVSVPAGLQAGTFPILLSAQSLIDPSLVAHAEVNVTVNATAAGVDVEVEFDPLLHVPFFGAQVPTAYQVRIHNSGPVANTFQLTTPDVPAGFQIATSVQQITVPAGETAVVGLYLIPDGVLPAPGTLTNFTVQTVSTSDAGISDSETTLFVVPEIHGLVLLADPVAVSTIPGVGVETVLVLDSRGNVPETVTLEHLSTLGLSVEGLQSVTIGPGDLEVLFLTLTPDVGTPLNSAMSTTITASFGAPETVELTIPVQVAAPGVTAVSNAATFVRNFLNNTDLADRLEDLGIALTNLAGAPTSEIYKSQAVASLDSILTLLAVDPILVTYVDDLQDPRDALAAATAAADVLAALENVGAALQGFADAVFFRNEFNFELFLLPNSQVAQPQVPAQFELLIHHVGGVSDGIYNISLSDLPDSVLSQLSDTQVTLQRNEFKSVFITLTQDAVEELLAFSFTVNVSVEGYPEIAKPVVGSLTARDEFVSVVSVTATPPFTDVGGSVDVSARVLNAVNRQQQASASFVVKNAAGTVVDTSLPVNVLLTVEASLVTVPLGSIETAGLPDGSYTIEVTLTDENGQPIPGATGIGTLLVGLPLTASVDVTPGVLSPGTSTVTNTLEIEALAMPLLPPQFVGQAAVAGATDVVRNGDFVYVAGNAGISVFNIAGNNLDSPQFVRTVGFATYMLEMRNDVLVAVSAGNSARLDTYDLTDPSNPTLLGTTGILPYGAAADVVLTDTHAFIIIVNFVFNIAHDIVAQNGGVLAIDITNPAAPHLDGDAITAAGTPAGRDGVNDGVLFNNNGTNNDGIGVLIVDQSGGTQMTWSAALASPTILLVTGSSATGTDTQTGVGLVRVVDISDPSNMQLVHDLPIPGTVHVLDIAVQGKQALLTATEGGVADFNSAFPLTGNLVQATLDLSDPANPQIVRSERLERAAREVNYNVALQGGLFAFTSIGAPADVRGLFVVDARNPGDFIGIDVPARILGLTAEEDLIFTADGSSLIIYRLPPLDPLTLVGFAPFADETHGVAARDNVAYACSSNGIKVIDYSDPADPHLVGTAGSGAKFGCRIQDDLLLATRSIGGPLVLDVYSIENPLDPELLGSSPAINYTNLGSGLETTSTHAFISQFQVCFLTPSNDIYLHMGELLSIALNLNDPDNPTDASPALASVLFNTFGDSSPDPGDVSGCPQSGGDHNVFGLAMANAQIAYLAASTVSGGNTQAGVGRIHVVDVSDPANPNVVTDLDLPGTVQALGIGIQGDVALVIGSTSGWNDPFDGLRDGNLTVTTLDVSDPLAPQIIAHRTLERRARTFWTNMSSLSNGMFAFSSLDSDGTDSNAELLLIDVTNPRNPLVLETNVPLDTIPANSIAFDGEFLFTADTSGISIYEINDIPAIPVTAEVQIPNGTGVEVLPGSFNIPPDEIIPGVEFDTLVWNLTLTSAGPAQTIVWQSTVTDLWPGQMRDVTLGTTIQFGFQGFPGEIPLPPSSVVAEQVISLTPASLTVAPGEEAVFSILLENPSALDVTYDLSVAGIPQDWVIIDTPVTVPAGGSVFALLRLTADPFTSLGDYEFTVNATADGVTTSVSGTLILAGAPVLPDVQRDARGVVVSVLPVTAATGQGTAGNYVVRITNTGSASDDFVVFLNGLPAEFTTLIGAGVVQVLPGESNYLDIPLSIIPPVGTTPGDFPFVVTASSATLAAVTDTAAGSLTVLELGVDVVIAPGSGPDNSIVEMTVTNTGQTTDTYTLSLAGPAALVSQLGDTSVTLGPGQSIVVPINIGDIDFAQAGFMSLVGIATSQTNAVVQDIAESLVFIDESTGMDAQFDPPSIDLLAPGPANGLLIVENLGNVEDVYEVTIVQTTGPVTAQLIGLDGLAAQSVAVFRLPGLATGTFRLQTILTDEGSGSVTVRVTSLSNPEISVDRVFLINGPTANLPPTADAGGPYTVVAGQSVQLEGTGLDPDGANELLTYLWDLDGDGQFGETGTDAFHGDETGPTPTFDAAGLAAGSYTVVLRVIDPLGDFADDTATVTVQPAQLTVQQIVVNGGDAQRSNVETIDIVVTGSLDVQSLIDSGQITDLIGIFQTTGGSNQVPLTSANFLWNESLGRLTIDLTIDGFGGSRKTKLSDARFQLRLADSIFSDTDGLLDGLYRFDFHRLEADFNGDRTVDVTDRNLFFALYGAIAGDANYDFAVDLDGNGVIDTLDYSIWVRQYRKSV